MPGRAFVCAIVMMGVATPAAAGERSGYSPLPDTLRLLLQDEQMTYGAGQRDARAIPTAYEPLDDTLAAFETLAVPATVYLGDLQGRGGTLHFSLESPHAGFAYWPIASLAKPSRFGARAAIDEAMASYGRPPRMRGRSRLDTMVTFRLDGQQDTRTLSMRGPASVLNLIPVR